eukprot:4569998-Pyramimonas_sp.AAC.1
MVLFLGWVDGNFPRKEDGLFAKASGPKVSRGKVFAFFELFRWPEQETPRSPVASSMCSRLQESIRALVPALVP